MTHNQEPLVSVFIPTYNRPFWLKETLDCVLKQTYKNIEIIVSNNCSEDLRVDELCKEYALKDNRIRYFCQSENIGGVKNYKFCVKQVKGDYMFGLCDDDRIEPSYIEKTLKKLISDEKAVACWSGINFMDEDGNPIKKQAKHDSPDCSSNNTVSNLVRWNMQFGWYGMFLIKSEYLKDNRIDINYKNAFGQDVFFISQLLLDAKILKVDEPLYHYRTRNQTCTEYYQYQKPIYNEYTNINPYADQLMKTFELIFESKKINFVQKIEFYLKMWSNILFVDSTWLDNRVLTFPLKKFYQKLIDNKNYAGLLFLFPILFFCISQKVKLFLKRTQFFLKPIKKGTVLVAELNANHGEVVAGYVKYFLDLGHNVDVLMSNKFKKHSPLADLVADERVNTICLSKKMYNSFFSLNRNKKYEYFFFTSYRIFYTSPKTAEFTINSYLSEMVMPKNKVLYVEHHLEQAEKHLLENKQIIALADLKYDFMNIKPVVVNPHYFGDVKITDKNDNTTNFIIIGSMEIIRRNFGSFVEVLENLNTDEKVKISIVSKTPKEVIISQIPMHLHKYFEFCGELNFPDLFKKMEESDFFLPLLDADCSDHDRYIKYGTSGSFQLIYGFAKPCIIHSKFAAPHGFNEENSLMYSSEADYIKMLETAIKMPKSEYKKLQENLIILKNNIYAKSLNNLKNCLCNEIKAVEKSEETILTSVH